MNPENYDTVFYQHTVNCFSTVDSNVGRLASVVRERLHITSVSKNIVKFTLAAHILMKS